MRARARNERFTGALTRVDLPGDRVDLLGLHVAREGPLGGAAASGQQGGMGGKDSEGQEARYGHGQQHSASRPASPEHNHISR